MTFKVGDKVYCEKSKLYGTVRIISHAYNPFPVIVDFDLPNNMPDGYTLYGEHGTEDNNELPSLRHQTKLEIALNNP